MTISDPIADMLTRIRNVAMAGQSLVVMPNSKLKSELARILQEEGYLESFEIVDGKVEGTKELRLKLKYIGERRHRRPIITGLTRVSRPGCRVYTSKEEIPWVLSGIGIAIISTPKGIMTGQRARKIGVGGEILCKVW
ncbi:MAG: 30S ribosomal protein S8 [Anaerolineaceae bacterium]|jgi:small subunit ribosomal protein S8|nr:30S ribosomal protein S8 [Anaerolineaceae bacterium]HNX45473.1 30S ribosomal protein S8 [Anaerolineaceae bacterium]HPT23008.1 30S ribosomal protein S8 [Anaerolineaceae bacterium]